MHWKTMLKMGGLVLECMAATARIGLTWDLHTRRRDSWVTLGVTARCYDIDGNHVQKDACGPQNHARLHGWAAPLDTFTRNLD